MTSFQKILIGIVIILVILNSFLLVFIWVNRPSARPDFRPGNEQEITGRHLLKSLDFDEQQAKLFKNEVRKHRQKISAMAADLRAAKHQINQSILLDDSISFFKADSLHQVLYEQMEGESQDFTRFIASICTAEQRQKLIKMQKDFRRRKPRP